MNGLIKLQQENKCWEAYVDGNKATYSWAKSRAGKWQEQTNEFKSGKNIGKANETTPHDQAVIEVRSKVNKKIVEGYKVIEATGCLENMELKEAPKSPLPMLAQGWDDQSHKMIGKTCHIQRKFDGHRCVANPLTGELFTRTGEPILGVPHISEQILSMTFPKEIQWLDGEMYNHDLSLQEISSIVRQQKVLDPFYRLIEYNVYDCIDQGCQKSYDDRSILLNQIVQTENVKIVESLRVVALKAETVDHYHDEYVSEGYEGAMVRLASSKYQIDKRSMNLLKVKKFDQEEFPIVNLNREKHKETLGTFTLLLPNGNMFDSTPKMPDKAKQKIWDERNQTNWQEYMATVRFRGYSDTGVPNINVTRAIRHMSDM